ncbi:MAG: UDP-N-acetylmuramoyl-tripeptide--D-alanyl-D-alanine ligase [Spirochaetota bacterium]
MFARLDYDFFTVAAVCSNAVSAIHSPKFPLRSITTSSLEVEPGSLFVPLTDRRDGHEFIADALDRGAAAFFVRKGHEVLKKLDEKQRSLGIVVDDPLLALGRLAAFHRNRFAPLVIAVTGSNGKTTTKEMLGQIFRTAFGRGAIYTEKNYNNHIGVPFTLFRIGRETRVAVIEMGMNHAGEIEYLSRMARPQVSVISSIGHAHIEFLGSRRNIALAKAEITDGQQKGGVLYVPAQVAELATLSSRSRSNGIRLKKIQAGKSGVLGISDSGPKGYELLIGRTPVVFRHANSAWLSNLALATAVAHDAGLPEQVIAKAVRSFRAPDGRMQVSKGYFHIIDDGYNANPDSAIASIAAARQYADGRPVVCVFGDFKELGKFSRSLHEWTGKEAAKARITAFYGIGRDMHLAAKAYHKAAGKKGRSYAFERSNVPAIVAQLLQEAKGSVILVKGSRSMQMEAIVQSLQSAIAQA